MSALRTQLIFKEAVPGPRGGSERNSKSTFLAPRASDTAPYPPYLLYQWYSGHSLTLPCSPLIGGNLSAFDLLTLANPMPMVDPTICSPQSQVLFRDTEIHQDKVPILVIYS